MENRKSQIIVVLLTFLLIIATVPIIGTQSDSLETVLTGRIYDQGIDTDGDESFNFLEIGVEINVTKPGYYYVYVSGLRDKDWQWIDVWGSESGYLDVGLGVLNISLSGYRIRASRLNASHVSYISLQNGYYSSISDVPLSREYNYTEFDAPAVLTSIVSDEGLDTDDDGTYNFLEIGVQVNVSDPGNYEVSVSGLLDSDFNYIGVYASKSVSLEAGLHVVYLSLEGPRIYRSYRNPRYINHVSLWFWEEDYWREEYWDELSQVLLSRQYYYTEFDPPEAMLTGKIHDRGLDTDDDETFDYLEVSVEVNVTKAGEYRVDVSSLYEIYEEDMGKYHYYIDVWGSASGHLGVGLGTLNVSLYGPAIYVSHHNPTHVGWISLYASQNDFYKYLEDINDVPLLGNYSYTDFDIPAIIVGVVSDQGVDYDADGHFDYLEIGVQVNVTDPGTYSLYASGLSDADSTRRYVWDVQDSKSMYLDKGIHTVKFYFYGPSIHVARCNPAKVSYISVEWQYNYRTYYDSKNDVPLTKQYSYTQFDAPLMAVETKFVVYPDGRVGVEGAVKYTDMVPKYRGPTAQGSFNLTSTQALADLTVNLPPEIANEFPFNSTTVDLLAKYSNGLLNLGINSTMVLPQVLASQYPFNSTNGTLNVTYSEGILNIEVEGNTTLPSLAAQQFPFNATDITVVGAYSPHTLEGRVTFSVLDGFTFDDVNVDFTGNQTDLTLNGTVHVIFNLPLGDFIIRNETELIQIIDQLKSELPGIVRNMTGGLLNVTNLNIDHELNGEGALLPGARVTFKISVHGDFVRALAYVMSGGRNEMLLYPALNEAYESVQSGSFDVRYSYETLEASMKLTFSYDLKRLIDYILTPPTGTTPYIMTCYHMSPTIYLGDVIFVEPVTDAGDIEADPVTGDIIAFYSPSYSWPHRPGGVVAHRAINKTFVNGTWYFQTKGDADYSPDNWTENNTYNGMIPENLLIGNVSSRIPLLGSLLSYPYPPYHEYYEPYFQSTIASHLSLLKAEFSSVQSMSIQLSYSSADKRFDFQLSEVVKLKELADEFALKLPDILPPETPPELKSFVESLLNTTYASVSTAQASLSYENGKADFKATATIEGDLNAELNYVKDLFFQLIGAQYSGYNMTIPWQAAFINQTKIDVSNLRISAKLDETSFEGRVEGLTLQPPIDAINATHFKLERFFNLTAPQYPGQQEFPGQYQKLKITIEGGSNATHGVTIFRDPQTVPEPDATAPHTMIWDNQTLSSLKDLVFTIRELNQYDLGWIVGKVVDADSLSPIVGASITADGLTATTDTNGCYIISNVSPGDYTVTVSAAGYATESKSTHLDSGVTITVNFEATLPGTVDGTVTDASTGLPIEGASINIDGYATTTNAEGYYKIPDVSPGDYTVTASANGYLSDSKSAHVDSGVTTTVNFALSPAGTLSVTTTPIAGEVFVNGTSWGVAPMSRTVAVGTYNVSFGPVTGYHTPTWQMAIVYKNVETTVTGIYELEKVSSTISINIDPSSVTVGSTITISGTITPTRANVDVSIYYRVAGGEWVTLATVKTDSQGRYTYTWITTETGTYEVKSSWLGDENTLSAQSEVKTLSVYEPVLGAIDGTVTDASTGLPIAGAIVTADGHSATTDPPGYYIITDIPVRTYNVTASKVGYESKTEYGVVVSTGLTTTVDFDLTPLPTTGSITGRVTDALTGEAIVGATVTSNGYTDTTDVNGEYTLLDVVPGDYTVTVSASGYVDKSKTATVTAGKTTVVNFALAVPGVVVGEITKPELVNPTNPFRVDATQEAATSLIISEISDPITIVVQKVTEPEGVAPPPGTWKVLGNYVQIIVNNTDITVNATIRMYYTLEQLEASGLDEGTLQIHFWNTTSGEWEPIESHVNTEEHYVWAIIDHFSIFAILGQPSEAAAPLITQLWFLPIVGIAVAVIAMVTVIIIIRKRKPQ